MVTFYLIAGGLAVLAAALLVRPLVAGRTAADGRDTREAQVFRDQLAEIERDLARGTITPGEAEGARVEVSRRLLAADERARRDGGLQPAPQGHSGLIAGLALVGTPALAAALYLGIGAPGVPDQPLASRPEAIAALGGTAVRPGQAEAEAAMASQLEARRPEQSDTRYAAMVAQLETVLEQRPDDMQGHRLLANALMNLGRYAEAWRSYGRVIELAGGTADADTHASKAEGMILAAGGYVSPEAADELARALELDPTLPIARYYGGLALQQAGRTDEAVAMWERLRRESPEDAPYLPWLDRLLAEARPGAPGVPGAPAPGPTREDIAAAEKLSSEERTAMIDGMVSRLDQRLRAQGGTAEDWGRLIASYATLGRGGEAADAYARALAALDGADAEAVRAQAARLGIAAADGAAAGAGAPSGPAAPGAGGGAVVSGAEATNPAAGTAATGGTAPGPTEADIAAASEMAPEERTAMIEGMVARLESRLTDSGGTAEEWLRLIGSYATLGRGEDAARAYRLAADALAGDPQAGFVREQALLMGVAVE